MYRPDLRSVKDTVPEEPEGIQHLNQVSSECLLFLLDLSCKNLQKVISAYLKGTGNGRGI